MRPLPRAMIQIARYFMFGVIAFFVYLFLPDAAHADERLPEGVTLDFNFGPDPITLYWSPASMGLGAAQGFTIVIHHGRFYRREHLPSSSTDGACFFHIDRPFFLRNPQEFDRNRGGRITLRGQHRFITVNGETAAGGWLLGAVDNPSIPAARFVCATRGVRADMSLSLIETHLGKILTINGRPINDTAAVSRTPSLSDTAGRGPPER